MKLIIDIPEEYKEQFIKNKCDDLFNSLATNEFGYVLRKSFETATLETQPCEDCISRKLLSDNICEGISCNECSFNEIDGESGCLLQKRFDELSSVTPTRPTGKWKELEKIISPNELICECSVCGHVVSFLNDYPKSNYCPKCGARMGESEEEE